MLSRFAAVVPAVSTKTMTNTMKMTTMTTRTGACRFFSNNNTILKTLSRVAPAASTSCMVLPPNNNGAGTLSSFWLGGRSASIVPPSMIAGGGGVRRLTKTYNRSLSSAATAGNHDMFCRQCEQTNEHKACVTVGVCGKTSETSAAQDALMAIIRNVSHWAVAAQDIPQAASTLRSTNRWTLAATFSTLTNVNFSAERIASYCREGEQLKYELMKHVPTEFPSTMNASNVAFDFRNASVEEIEEFGFTVSVPAREMEMNHVDAFSLNEIATYGLKGACAYAMHVEQLVCDTGGVPLEIMNEIQRLWSVLDSPVGDMDLLLETVLKVGELNSKVLAALDQAHVDNYGVPEPTQIRTTAVEGKCILVSGHDMKDLFELLKQTENTGINVYTHGEMMPAHTYPELKKFKHLAGNYGTAWQNQKFEFATFPGPIIVTTNCVLEPRRMYKNRLFTMNEVGVDGVAHIGPDRNYGPVIELAKQSKGFPLTFEPARFHLAGFNHRVVMGIADKVVDAAKNGKLSRIFLIGGCDGSQWDRSYFTDLAEETPEDSMILTLGCAKNRVIHSHKLQEKYIGDTGIPRVIDMGQCNDSYSAVVVAIELAKALQVDSVNDLPLSLAISHLEQKAAAVLCTLLYLGIKNIRLGPTLPAYITPNILNVLQKNYNLKAVGNYQSDLKSMMAGK